MWYIWISVAIIIAGYLIGEGLGNVNRPKKRSIISCLLEDEDDIELIKEKDLHYTLGISREDLKTFLEKYPEIPSVELNGTHYYTKMELKKWMTGL